jgi:hypothetical protein
MTLDHRANSRPRVESAEIVLDKPNPARRVSWKVYADSSAVPPRRVGLAVARSMVCCC